MEPEERAEILADLHRLADFLAEHPGLPVPRYGLAISVHAGTDTGTGDGDPAEVDSAAAILGTEPVDGPDGRRKVRHQVGNWTYEVLHIPAEAMADHEARMQAYRAFAPGEPAAADVEPETCRRCAVALVDGKCPECASYVVTYMACGDQLSDTALITPGTPLACPRHGETIAITAEQWLAEHPPELEIDPATLNDALADADEAVPVCASCGATPGNVPGGLIPVHDTGGDGATTYYCADTGACQARATKALPAATHCPDCGGKLDASGAHISARTGARMGPPVAGAQ